MSTRAYKVVIPAQLAKAPAWNVSRQDEINDYLDLEDYEGEQAVEVGKIKELLEDPAIELDPGQRKQFMKDIAGEDEDDVIYYQLF